MNVGGTQYHGKTGQYTLDHQISTESFDDDNSANGLDRLLHNQYLISTPTQPCYDENIAAMVDRLSMNDPVLHLRISRLLLSPRGVVVKPNSGHDGSDTLGICVCETCKHSLDRGNKPKLSIANGFCISCLPEELLAQKPPEAEIRLVSPTHRYGYERVYSPRSHQLIPKIVAPTLKGLVALQGHIHCKELDVNIVAASLLMRTGSNRLQLPHTLDSLASTRVLIDPSVGQRQRIREVSRFVRVRLSVQAAQPARSALPPMPAAPHLVAPG